MTLPNQTANRWRLGPRTPEHDPWGRGVWDSNCDLYDAESDKEIDSSAIGTFTAPIILSGGAEPTLGQQVLFGVLTPPCDRFAVYVTYLKQASFSQPLVVTPFTKLAPWVIQVRRGMDCVDEPNTAATIVKFAPPTFQDKGLILQLSGSPLSTWWVFAAFQTTTTGTDVPWTGAFRVICDRNSGCCNESAQLGPNTSNVS